MSDLTSRAVEAPTPPDARFEIIDIVRGFALFGVLLANMVWTTQSFALTDGQRAALPSASIDRLASSLVTLLVDYKFYTLFSMLFGLGFAMQLSRAAGRSQKLLPVYARRLAILFFLGAAHGTLLWFGDILHTYALVGLVLILFRNRSDRVVLGWALGIAALVAVLPLLQWTAGAVGTAEVGADAVGETAAAARFAALSGDSWSDIVDVNWGFHRDEYGHPSFGFDGIIYWYLSVLWKFLLGFFIGRRMLLQEAERHLGLFRRLLPWALGIGLATNAVWSFSYWVFGVTIPDHSSALVRMAWIPIELGMLALSLAYLSGLVLLHQRPGWRRWLGTLAPMGRMALTNYLSQSVLLVALFYGVGLGLLGRAGTAACVVFSIVIFALQVAFSGWWLKRFRFGPAEWAWRSLTYGRRQPLRLERRLRPDRAV